MEKKTHILILGGTGFLGSQINKYFKNNSKYIIQNIGSKEIDLRENNLSSRLIELYEEDSTIIFLSAVKRNYGDNIHALNMNSDICRTVALALEQKKVNNLIYLSSCAVYGEKNNQFKYDENSPINPTSFYGLSKCSNELLMKLMNKNGRIKNLAILRPTTIYGDKKDSTYCPSGFLMKALKENKIELWGDGKEKRDFFNVENFLSVANHFIDNPSNITLNLVSGNSISFYDLAIFISKKKKNLEISNKTRTNPVVDHTYKRDKLIKNFPELNIKLPLDWINDNLNEFNIRT
jgi:nucleoside-diphosphate-sugar epimerase